MGRSAGLQAPENWRNPWLANRLGISTAGVGYVAQRGGAFVHGNGDQLIQRDIDFFKVSPYNSRKPSGKTVSFPWFPGSTGERCPSGLTLRFSLPFWKPAARWIFP